MPEYPPHKLALIVPLATEADYRVLAHRIAENGQREPIVLLDGGVLDGRNRQRACRELGLQVTTREYGSRATDGTDPLAFVLDLNAGRRHMNTTQRAKAAANLVDEWGDLRGRRSQKSDLPGRGQNAETKAGDVFGVGSTTVYMARQIKRRAPDLFDLMDGVTLKMGAAAQTMKARERQGAEPTPGRRERTPTVKPTDQRVEHRRVLGLLTQANAAAVDVNAEADVLTAAIGQIKHSDDVVKLAMNVGWSVRYLRGIERRLRARLDDDELGRVDAALASAREIDGQPLKVIAGGRSR